MRPSVIATFACARLVVLCAEYAQVEHKRHQNIDFLFDRLVRCIVRFHIRKGDDGLTSVDLMLDMDVLYLY